VNPELIIDVGMHTGRDTDFYLKKGFRVVAIEANPALVASARSLFSDPIARGLLTIHEVAIAGHEGEIDFYVNAQHDDWGTTSAAFASRNERFGTDNSRITVRCTRFNTILKEHGIPYYLKIDIEGADMLCLETLRDFEERPRYVSIEAGLTSVDETLDELSTLSDLGYTGFKIVNQAMNHRVRCPMPPLEGDFVDYQFDGTCSGPFGEEAPGNWASLESTFRKYRRLLIEQKYFGAAGPLYRTVLQRIYERLKGEPAGWYDFHARLGDH
jgi:FkbM family methyltransferase